MSALTDIGTPLLAVLLALSHPAVVGGLLIALAEAIAGLAWLGWRAWRLWEDCVYLAETADLQGDALREALNEIDRLRRPAKPGR
jgi:hypothetical protein